MPSCSGASGNVATFAAPPGQSPPGSRSRGVDAVTSDSIGGVISSAPSGDPFAGTSTSSARRLGEARHRRCLESARRDRPARGRSASTSATASNELPARSKKSSSRRRCPGQAPGANAAQRIFLAWAWTAHGHQR